MNKVILLGTLGRDPEKRTFENGGHIWQFSLVTDKRYQTKEGEWETDAQWHNIKYYGDRLSENAKKGSQVLLEGELRYWKSETSGKTGVEIVVPKFSRITVTREPKGSSADHDSDPAAAAAEGA
ncbi:hypothetical protein HDU87_007618 [Geranomyces variabilis]|uniref:Single-stranded DNA-binding protein n=1 Tax=Geranomyces variabilis TaxID=109894 RepID=A0AAD5XMQ6_9FUNG|nr:hypothetical protein HDU87_007618 [Geranomyces variabilis]